MKVEYIMKRNRSFIPKIPIQSNISIRLPDELIARIEMLAEKQKMSRNEFIKQAILYAMTDLDDTIKE